MTSNVCSGIERRDQSECPLTARQAYQILDRLDQLIEKQEKNCEQQRDIINRLNKIERYIFAGRVVFWFITSAGLVAAWSVGFLHDLREFIRK